MSYQVIARKYRPQRFQDVVGQEHVTQTLINAISQGRIAHAYLFCGPRGTGKTTIARIFAKCLNCTGGPKVDFDDADPRCQEITEGRSIDVLEIDGASNNGVEQVRELRETVKYAPASSQFKIYIIDEVHMLTTAAFNALLKTLEEPPAHVKFMFATTDPEKVLPTILSRCQRFDLRRIPVALITDHLRQIAKQEKVKIDAEALHAIARGADGGMRDAESALDQLISFCGDAITESDVLSMFGLTARSAIVALANGVLLGQPAVALGELNILSKHGKDLGRLLSDLLGHFRNLLIYQVSQGDFSLIEVSELEVVSLKEQHTLVTTEALTRIMEVLTEAEGSLRDAASKKIFIEVALLKAIQARNAPSVEDLLKQLVQLREETGGSGGVPPPAGAVPGSRSPESRQGAARSTSSSSMLSAATGAGLLLAEPEVAAATPHPKLNPSPDFSRSESAQGATVAAVPSAARPGPAPVPQEGAILSEDDLVALWHNILEAVGRASPFAKNYLIEAHPVSLAKNVFTIGFDPEFAEHIDLVNNQKTHTLLQTKFSESGRPNMQIKFIKADRPENWINVPGSTSSVDNNGPGAASTPAEAAFTASPPASVTPTATQPRVGNGSSPNEIPPGPPSVRKEKAPQAINAEEFKKDPLIQKALEIFKGRIVEVRA